LKSRYLLTFASASITNEWWLLLQTNFPDTSRPGPQLFNFKTDDLLSKVWRHPAFAHLKSKWMYISFSDASNEGIGGAAQGIIPVQDEYGNMLGGTAPASPTRLANEVRMEAQGVRTEVHKLEEYFEKMMAAVERNTERVADLADKRMHKPRTSHDETLDALSQASGSADSGTVDMGVLAGHFVRMNDLLAKNSQHVESLAKKHHENEQKLSEALQALASKQAPLVDVDRLSSHLDRIQAMMEASVQERKDSARDISEYQQRPLQIDWSPLTDRLQKVQEAVEQNSQLVKELLDEGTTEPRPGTPFWGKDQSSSSDLSPLTEHLQRIHEAVEKQSEHMKALVGFASSGGDDREGSSSQAAISLAPLSEHLEQIYNAIEEGNKHSKQPTKLDLKPLSRHLEALHTNSAANVDSLNRLIESQDATREAIEANGGEIDFTPMTEYLEAIKESSDAHTSATRELLASQQAVREAVENNGGEIDFTPMTEYLEAIQESSNTHTEAIRELLASQEATRKESVVDFTPLNTHLNAVREATDRNSDHIKTLVDANKASAKPTPNPSMDFTPLTDRLNRIHGVLEKSAERQQAHSEGIGDAKFIMNALTSHLSKIQGVTDQNAQHIKALHDKQSSAGDKMQTAVSETSDQVQSLIQRNKEQEARIDAQNSQMRELMSGQREMVEVMRQLARSVVAQNKGSCDHVVVPPPRKMGRKVVGFVYDAKEGQVDDRPKAPERSMTSRPPERPNGPERRYTTNV
jgi:hypothetical protein